MSKMFPRGSQALLTSLLLFGVASFAAQADDRFSLAVGQHGDLLIFGPKGEKVADLPIPSISQAVTVSGTTSFQVSYGRDVNDKLTAILAPNPTQPENLHFNVLNKNVDADKAAVVTLTFSRGLGSVTVDPGYVGLVQVNDHTVRHRALADDSYTPAPAPSYPSSAPSAPMASSPAPAYNPPPRMDTQVAPRDTAPNPDGYDHRVAAATDNGPDSASATVTDASTSADSHKPLFWSEPVTGPDGRAPHVAVDQMKLVEVHGSVSIRDADGTSHDGSNGMIVPSGAVVSTSDDSSAAVFIGGVDSARLMPDSDLRVAQNLDGSVRHTRLDLQKGAVFSRVGHRVGENQQYQVATPQGVAAARGTDYLVFILDGYTHVVSKDGPVELFIDGRSIGTVRGHGGPSLAFGSMPPGAPDERNAFLRILFELQQFNTKTNAALDRVNGHTATAAEVAYYEAALLGAQYEVDALSSIKGLLPQDYYYLGQIGSGITVALHDLLPFSYTQATPVK